MKLFYYVSKLIQITCAQKFFPCKDELALISSDSQAYDMVEKAYVKDKMKFSSECLEILLKKNYMNASEYLMENYYPKTSIDTEIIVKSVAQDI